MNNQYNHPLLDNVYTPLLPDNGVINAPVNNNEQTEEPVSLLKPIIFIGGALLAYSLFA